MIISGREAARLWRRMNSDTQTCLKCYSMVQYSEALGVHSCCGAPMCTVGQLHAMLAVGELRIMISTGICYLDQRIGVL